MTGEGSMRLSQLLKGVARALKREFPASQWVMAEILELNVNRSGHCYMELIEKDPDHDTILAKSRATIWASKFSLLRPHFESATGTRLKSGIKLLFKGSVEFHPQYGFSINITDLDPAYTLGDLARKKQEVINRLRGEGVMEMNRELPFPSIPQRIAVISSETAAGFGDFMETINNNSHGFAFHTRLFPAVMQGDEAPASMTGAFDLIHSSGEPFDCVVIIRGGGSRADLECYNSYELAYYITQFPLPVITGIGHERDESVADMVAARGLKTPTAVGEFLVDQLLSFEFRLSAYHESLTGMVSRSMKEQGFLLERLAASLSLLAQGHLRSSGDHLEQSALAMQRGVRNLLVRRREQTDRWQTDMERGVQNLLVRTRDHLALLETRNGLVDPRNILKRGYSMTLLDGKAISGTEGIGVGDQLETHLYRGKVISIVEKTIKNNDKGKAQL